jgi:hypothetical protein
LVPEHFAPCIYSELGKLILKSLKRYSVTLKR